MVVVVNMDRKTNAKKTNALSCVDQSLFRVSHYVNSIQLTRVEGTDIDFHECTNEGTYTAPNKYLCTKSKGGSVLTCKDSSQCYSIVLTSLLSGSATRLKDASVAEKCASK